jgi:hypothetical protein
MRGPPVATLIISVRKSFNADSNSSSVMSSPLTAYAMIGLLPSVTDSGQ